ncbi:MAG: ABC-2 family transporter protein, partial [Candidatus Latescibacteria bacterium]|nr:ABC-2 family transporter protein [Candidatus Latescibacterota bacterium]
MKTAVDRLKQLSLYAYLIRLQVLNSLAYRFEYFSSIGTNVFFLFGSVYLWKSAYKGISSVGQVAEEQMVTYAIVSVLMTALFSINVNQNLFAKIRQGDIAVDFIRPANLLYFWLAEDLGLSLSAITRFCLPVLLVSALFVKVPLPADPLAGVLFLPSCVLSYLILWQLSALIGLTAFWVIELGNIGSIKDMIVLILSGRMVPLWLFPDIVQRLSAFLPFQYTY